MDSDWNDVRRLIVLYALLLGASAILTVAIALRIAPQAPLTAIVSVSAGAIVCIFAFRDRSLIAPLLDPRKLTLGPWKAILVGTPVAVLVLLGCFEALEAMGVPFVRYWPPFEQAGWPPWAAFVLIAGCPAVFEEIAFRGVIYEGLQRSMTRRDALLVQAMSFSVLHLSPAIFVSHFLMGLALGMLRDGTRSLYPCMLAHASWNAWVLGTEIGLV